MKNCNCKFKKLKFKEIISILEKTKYWEDINIDDICDGIVKYYGCNAKYAVLNFNDEYNDSSCDFRVTDLTVYDDKNVELIFSGAGDYSAKDQYHSWKYSLTIGEQIDNANRSLTNLKIDIKNKTILSTSGEIPELYTKL